jgi:hypothetical protein
MSLTKEEASRIARADLAERLGLDENEVAKPAIETAEFPNTALGALEEDEMAGEMITSGWRISLQANGKNYEYRADEEQVRLYDFNGSNFLIYE